ncbi:MAG: hypothetical protein WA885_18180 [Phormidesmis sp.]
MERAVETGMINPATETFGQARQGSVAAIILVLNERLADVGIRTRAVVADGMLQLLCEAATPEQLEKAAVIERVRQILEAISPHRIRKVKINSRIVKEEQLLWLEEIKRDPERNLLWAEVITLKRPFFVKRWIRDRHLRPAGPIFRDITEPERNHGSIVSILAGGAGLVMVLLVALWVFREDIGLNRPAAIAPTDDSGANRMGAQSEAARLETIQPETEAERAADTTPQIPPADSNPLRSDRPIPNQNSNPTPPPIANSGSIADAFAEAVRVAEQAAVSGQTASTAAEWLDLAARWQKASDLMATIPTGSEQYAVAQTRIADYRANSKAALEEATAIQNQSP